MIRMIVGINNRLDRLGRHFSKGRTYPFAGFHALHGIDNNDPIITFNKDRVRQSKANRDIKAFGNLLHPLGENFGVFGKRGIAFRRCPLCWRRCLKTGNGMEAQKR